MGRECLLLANNGLSGHVPSTSAPPPRADIHWPMSVIVPISSALPLKPDVAAGGRESPKMTHNRLSQEIDAAPQLPLVNIPTGINLAFSKVGK